MPAELLFFSSEKAGLATYAEKWARIVTALTLKHALNPAELKARHPRDGCRCKIDRNPTRSRVVEPVGVEVGIDSKLLFLFVYPNSHEA